MMFKFPFFLSFFLYNNGPILNFKQKSQSLILKPIKYNTTIDKKNIWTTKTVFTFLRQYIWPK